MPGTYVVIEKTLAMFLVLLVGWIARRRSYVEASFTATLSRFTTDVALPALIFGQMLKTVDRAVLARSWMIPVAAAGVLALGQLVGWFCWRAFATRAQAPTFIFVVSIANWIYLPLPIVEPLFGPAGVRVLLLCNVGVQIYLWTVGVATLKGGRIDPSSLWSLLTNPGLIATVGGILIALFPPPTIGGTAGRLFFVAVTEALLMVGNLTIPLSLFATGSHLGAIPLQLPGKATIGVIALRLIVTPAAALAIALMLRCLGVDRTTLVVLYLIAAMPVAISCSILTERFQQDVNLAAQSIFYTTITGLATVPLAYWAFNLAI